MINSKIKLNNKWAISSIWLAKIIALLLHTGIAVIETAKIQSITHVFFIKRALDIRIESAP